MAGFDGIPDVQDGLSVLLPMQQATGIERKNRETTAKVLQRKGASSFSAAMDAIVPMMRKRGLFD
jgi:hypothetical protein